MVGITSRIHSTLQPIEENIMKVSGTSFMLGFGIFGMNDTARYLLSEEFAKLSIVQGISKHFSLSAIHTFRNIGATVRYGTTLPYQLCLAVGAVSLAVKICFIVKNYLSTPCDKENKEYRRGEGQKTTIYELLEQFKDHSSNTEGYTRAFNRIFDELKFIHSNPRENVTTLLNAILHPSLVNFIHLLRPIQDQLVEKKLFTTSLPLDLTREQAEQIVLACETYDKCAPTETQDKFTKLIVSTPLESETFNNLVQSFFEIGFNKSNLNKSLFENSLTLLIEEHLRNGTFSEFFSKTIKNYEKTPSQISKIVGYILSHFPEDSEQLPQAYYVCLEELTSTEAKKALLESVEHIKRAKETGFFANLFLKMQSNNRMLSFILEYPVFFDEVLRSFPSPHSGELSPTLFNTLKEARVLPQIHHLTHENFWFYILGQANSISVLHKLLENLLDKVIEKGGKGESNVAKSLSFLTILDKSTSYETGYKVAVLSIIKLILSTRQSTQDLNAFLHSIDLYLTVQTGSPFSHINLDEPQKRLRDAHSHHSDHRPDSLEDSAANLMALSMQSPHWHSQVKVPELEETKLQELYNSLGDVSPDSQILLLTCLSEEQFTFLIKKREINSSLEILIKYISNTPSIVENETNPSDQVERSKACLASYASHFSSVDPLLETENLKAISAFYSNEAKARFSYFLGKLVENQSEVINKINILPPQAKTYILNILQFHPYEADTQIKIEEIRAHLVSKQVASTL
jgi:hypothetical protein